MSHSAADFLKHQSLYFADMSLIRAIDFRANDFIAFDQVFHASLLSEWWFRCANASQKDWFLSP
ncbi:protein of unknown function [Aminobacter niigataensis]|nr:protein of unknown function [Aminobacter niigataensis]